MTTSSFTYVARYRLGNLTKLMIALGLIVGVAGIFAPVPEDPKILLTAVPFAIAGALVAIYLPMQLRGVVALRVDDKGIFFGGRPLVYKWTSTFVPWDKIADVYLFRVRQWGLRVSYIGLQGFGDEEPMASVIPVQLAETIWHVPTSVVKASRPAFGWQIDREAFISAANYFAPSVMVVDLTEALPLPMPLA